MTSGKSAASSVTLQLIMCRSLQQGRMTKAGRRSSPEWLKGSRLGPKDGVLVLSVGGGNLEHNVSPNLVKALQHAKEAGASIVGIVGRDGGFTAQVGDAVVVIPTVNPMHVTPHAEAFQGIVWHLLVSHPQLKLHQTKWESAEPVAVRS